jgi:hypothetical protein
MTFKSCGNGIDKYIGCDVFTARKWVEQRFADGMNWDNYGPIWVIDHVVPIRMFDQSDENELLLCWNYKNMLPLFRKDNFNKEGNLFFSYIILSRLKNTDWYYNKLFNIILPEIEAMDKYIDVYLMVSLYKEITSTSEAINADGFKEQLEDLNVLNIFGPLYEEFKDKPLLLIKKIVLYILYCYSMDSPKISINGDRGSEKGTIFRALNFPYKDDKELNTLYEQIVMLRSSAVVLSATAWMEKQGERQFQYYITLQESYFEMQRAALMGLQNSHGGIDYDQKQRCIEHMTDTRKLIKEAESALQQNSNELKGAHQELKSAREKHKFVGPESFAKKGSNGVPEAPQPYR